MSENKTIVCSISDFETGSKDIPRLNKKELQIKLEKLKKERQNCEEKLQQAKRIFQQNVQRIDQRINSLKQDKTVIKAREKLEKYGCIYYFYSGNDEENPFDWKDTKSLHWGEFVVEYDVCTVDISENIEKWDKEVKVEKMTKAEFADQIRKESETSELKQLKGIEFSDNLEQWFIDHSMVEDNMIFYDDCQNWSGCGLDAFQGVYRCSFYLYIIKKIS